MTTQKTTTLIPAPPAINPVITISCLQSYVSAIDNGRSKWAKGVKEYAVDILANYADLNATNVAPSYVDADLAYLDGAQDWYQYSEGGKALVAGEDIADRLLTASQQKHMSYKRWYYAGECLEVQARALKQAMELIRQAYANK